MAKKHQKLKVTSAYHNEHDQKTFKTWCAKLGVTPFAMIRDLIAAQLEKWRDAELERD